MVYNPPPDYVVGGSGTRRLPEVISVRAFVLGLASLIVPASPAWSDESDSAAGRSFAERNCARCHAIGGTGESPYPPAPPFRTFAAKWPVEHLAEALAEGIVVGHRAMPEFTLTPTEIGDFIGYLKTLERP